MRRRGRKDGKSEKPGPNDQEAPELSALKQHGDGDVRRLAAWWHEIDNDLKGRWCGLRDERLRLLQRVEELEQPVKEAHTAYLERVKVRDRRRKDIDALPSELRHRLGPRVYGFLLLLLFVGEFPLNAIAFRLFGESELLTYVMTTALAVSLIFCAHVLGMQLRNENKNRDLIRAMIAIPLAAIGAIAYVREEYLSSHAHYHHGLAQLPTAGAIVVFAIVNLLVFAAASALSWARHDPHMRALTDAERDVRRAERLWRRRSDTLEEARALVAAVERQLDSLRAMGDGEFRKAKELAAAQKDDYEHLMDIYRAANLRARPAGIIPALEERPEIVIPKELLAEDHTWKCVETPDARQTDGRVILAPERTHILGIVRRRRLKIRA